MKRLCIECDILLLNTKTFCNFCVLRITLFQVRHSFKVSYLWKRLYVINILGVHDGMTCNKFIPKMTLSYFELLCLNSPTHPQISFLYSQYHNNRCNSCYQLKKSKLVKLDAKSIQNIDEII